MNMIRNFLIVLLLLVPTVRLFADIPTGSIVKIVPGPLTILRSTYDGSPIFITPGDQLTIIEDVGYNPNNPSISSDILSLVSFNRARNIQTHDNEFISVFKANSPGEATITIGNDSYTVDVIEPEQQ